MYARMGILWFGIQVAVMLGVLLGRSLPSQVIAYSARATNNADIHVADLERGLIVRLTDHIGNDIDPTWGPDGQHIAFTSDRAREGLFSLYMLDLTTREVIPLLPGESALQPTWSPDGQWIAYVDNGGSARSGRFLIYLIRPDGSEVRSLTPDFPYDTLTPAWSPDSTQIVFRTTGPALTNTLQHVNVTNGAITPLDRTVYASFPTFADDDTLLFTRNQTLYRWQDGDAERLITNAVGANVRGERVVFLDSTPQISYGSLSGDWQPTGISGMRPVWRP